MKIKQNAWVGMSYSIKIALDVEVDADYLHKFRNFGEDVWRELHDNCSVSLEEIDSSEETFTIKDVKQRELKRTVKKIEKIADAHFFSDLLKIVSTREKPTS